MKQLGILDYIGFGLAALLLLCLLHMPYGYYIFVRFVTAVIMVIFGVYFLNDKCIPLAITAFVIAVLFQPFIKLSLGRTLWNIIDVILAIVLILAPFIISKNKT